MENLGEEQDVWDLGYGEQGRVQSDTRKVGRGLYLEDSGEPWRNFKKERGVVTQSDFLSSLSEHHGRCMLRGRRGRCWKRLEAGRPVERLRC